MSLRSGLCQRCQREMALSQNREYYTKVYYKEPLETLPALARIKPAHEPLFTRVAKMARKKKVLDIGCGEGYLLSKLQPQPELYGTDMAPSAIRVAKSRIKEGNFCLGNATNIPFNSNIFDCIICTEVLEHIAGNDAVKEIYRVLKPGGVALITVPNGKGPSGESHPSHIRSFTFESITAFLEETGFEIVCGQKFGLFIPFVTDYLSLLSYVLGKNLPFSLMLNIKVPEFLAANFLIKCRKPAI